mmetsp:Transcript_15185/g.38039  ORF Transcript_15185/g.38039 Transcript_15185/m.38039 type:complete len:148 (-) Transcript_15185:215-658(-)
MQPPSMPGAPPGQAQMGQPQQTPNGMQMPGMMGMQMPGMMGMHMPGQQFPGGMQMPGQQPPGGMPTTPPTTSPSSQMSLMGAEQPASPPAPPAVALPSHLKWSDHEKAVMGGLSENERKMIIALKEEIDGLRKEVKAIDANSAITAN